MKNSKIKGSQWERDVAHFLDNLFGVKDCFWRTHGSGALMKFGHTNNCFAGDVYAIDPSLGWFNEKFYVECKFLKDLNIEANSVALMKIINKAMLESENKHLLIFLKRNFKEPLVITSFFMHKFDMAVRVMDRIFYLKYLFNFTFDDLKICF